MIAAAPPSETIAQIAEIITYVPVAGGGVPSPVEVTVAKDDFAFLKGGPNLFHEVLPSAGGVK